MLRSIHSVKWIAALKSFFSSAHRYANYAMSIFIDKLNKIYQAPSELFIVNRTKTRTSVYSHQ